MAIKIPQLPYGEGTIGITTRKDKEYVYYRKTINGKRVTVYGETPKECMALMREKEKSVTTQMQRIQSGSISLGEAITDWHKKYKKGGVAIKENSYDREFATMNNQLLKYPLARMQMQAIGSDNIVEHINLLIEKNYSYSTVKKTYELLNQFFGYYYAKMPNNNPMNTVIKPTKAAMNVTVKEIDFFDEEDIRLFVHEATRLNSKGQPIYRLGVGLVAIMYTFMRVNEARALHWSNIDLEKGTYRITSNIQKVIDHSKGRRPDGTYYHKVVETLPKTSAGIRNIYMCENAKQCFIKLKEIQNPASELDFVFATTSGSPDSERNLRRTLNNIQERAGMKVQNSGLHTLRHTGISLMARAGVDEMVVASMAGQSDTEMIHRVYRHVFDNEMIEAAQKINDIMNIKFDF